MERLVLLVAFHRPSELLGQERGKVSKERRRRIARKGCLAERGWKSLEEILGAHLHHRICGRAAPWKAEGDG